MKGGKGLTRDLTIAATLLLTLTLSGHTEGVLAGRHDSPAATTPKHSSSVIGSRPGGLLSVKPGFTPGSPASISPQPTKRQGPKGANHFTRHGAPAPDGQTHSGRKIFFSPLASPLLAGSRVLVGS